MCLDYIEVSSSMMFQHIISNYVIVLTWVHSSHRNNVDILSSQVLLYTHATAACTKNPAETTKINMHLLRTVYTKTQLVAGRILLQQQVLVPSDDQVCQTMA